MHKVRDLKELSPKWDDCTKPLPSSLLDLCGRKGRKTLKARDGGWLHRNCLPDTMVGIQITHSLYQCTQDLHKSKPDKTPALKTGSGHKVLALSNKLLALILPGRGKICFLQWNITKHFTQSPGQTECLRVVGKHKMDSLFSVRGLFLVLFWFFSYLHFICFVFVTFWKKKTWNWVSGWVGEEEDLNGGGGRKQWEKISQNNLFFS